MRANINLKRGTDRTGRIASRGFFLIAGEPIEIDQGRRFTLAYRLPPLVPFGGEHPASGPSVPHRAIWKPSARTWRRWPSM
jgi:hypothetical protein